MSDHGIIISSGFRFNDKIRSLISVRPNVVDGARGQEEKSGRVASTDTGSGNSNNKFQRDQSDTSFGSEAEKIGRWSMFNWFKRVQRTPTNDVKDLFADLHKSSSDVKAALEPYLDAQDPLVALTITLLSNKRRKKRGEDCDQSHS